MNSNFKKRGMASSSTLTDRSGKKVRKPYTITKSRESWTDEEHDKFIEALQMFDRDWKKIEDYIGSKTVIQIRSHAQKYFLKVQKNGTIAHVPPPRPKRKATHPYPQKATKNALTPFPASMDYPSMLSVLGSGDSSWAHAPTFLNAVADDNISSVDEYADIDADEVDVGLQGITTIGNNSYVSGSSSGSIPTADLYNQASDCSFNQSKGLNVSRGTPDFAEVYNFIGSVFDPDTEGHLQKLKEMDPVNFDVVLSLMKNLTMNLSSPEFEPIEKVLSAYAFHAKAEGTTNEVDDRQSC